MRNYSNNILELLNIQIGCIIKVNRIRKNISQHDLSLILDLNPTAIGRIERAEVISGWDRIFVICKELDINFASLFTLSSRQELLKIVEEIYQNDHKLNHEKKQYYNNLKREINRRFEELGETK